MANRYKFRKPMSNRDIKEGIVFRNGMFIVEEGMDEIFREIKYVREGFENGDIKFVGSDGIDGEIAPLPSDEPPPPQQPPMISYQAAYRLAEAEFHVDRKRLKDWLDGGQIATGTGSRLGLTEGEFRNRIATLVANTAEPEPEKPEEPEEPESTEDEE